MLIVIQMPSSLGILKFVTDPKLKKNLMSVMQEYLKLINNNYNLKLRIANSDNLLFI